MVDSEGSQYFRRPRSPSGISRPPSVRNVTSVSSTRATSPSTRVASSPSNADSRIPTLATSSSPYAGVPCSSHSHGNSNDSSTSKADSHEEH